MVELHVSSSGAEIAIVGIGMPAAPPSGRAYFGTGGAVFGGGDMPLGMTIAGARLEMPSYSGRSGIHDNALGTEGSVGWF